MDISFRGFRTVLRPCAIVACIMWSMPQSLATTMIEMTLEDLLAEADAVLVGTVSTVEARRSPDGVIFTFVTFVDLDVVYGAVSGESITMRVLGGARGNEMLHVEGAPVFQPQERVVVFGRDNGEAWVPFVGWEQGVFAVRGDPMSGRDEVVHDRRGNRVFGVLDGRVLTENRFEAQSTIIPRSGGRRGGAESANVESMALQGHGGRPTPGSVTGSTVTREPSAPALRTELVFGQPLTLDEFLQEIDAMVIDLHRSSPSFGAFQRPLASVDVGEFSGSSGVSTSIAQPMRSGR